MKKIGLLVISLLLITGCSVQYNLKINEDLTIVEEASLTGTEEFFANYYKTTKKNVIKDSLELYQDILKENNYSYELIDSSTPYVKVNKKYNNIMDYTKNSILFNDYFDEVKYTENGNIKKIETVGFNENNPDDPNRFYVKKLAISITCPYKVKNHNAKNVNKKTNTYYYELEGADAKILLEFDASKKFNPNSDIIIMILIAILVIIASWTTIYILNKRKNN